MAFRSKPGAEYSGQMTFFVSWQSKITASFYFALGLQPVFEVVAGLPTAGLKDLIGMFTDEIGQALHGTATGVRTIMNAGTTLICRASFLHPVKFTRVTAFRPLKSTSHRANIFRRPRTPGSKPPANKESPVADPGRPAGFA